MWTVNEVSKRTSVSVRTLHHYDAIGLLKPSRVTEAGYRLYDDTALRRLPNILMFRELQFPLKEIKAILDNPKFDPAEALGQQIHLLELQKAHIESLISFARELQWKHRQKGAFDMEEKHAMEFDVFDKKDIDRYAEEVKERWGSTQAYAECMEKAGRKNSREQEEAAGRLMEIFARIGALRHLAPEEKAVQDEVHALRQCITDNYYTCTPEILRGLGEMHVADERMRRNIDRAGGEGTAEFASKAISAYCAS